MILYTLIQRRYIFLMCGKSAQICNHGVVGTISRGLCVRGVFVGLRGSSLRRFELLLELFTLLECCIAGLLQSGLLASLRAPCAQSSDKVVGLNWLVRAC